MDLNEIRRKQIEAGENAVIAGLKAKGLIPHDESPTEQEPVPNPMIEGEDLYQMAVESSHKAWPIKMECDVYGKEWDDNAMGRLAHKNGFLEGYSKCLKAAKTWQSSQPIVKREDEIAEKDKEIERLNESIRILRSNCQIHTNTIQTLQQHLREKGEGKWSDADMRQFAVDYHEGKSNGSLNGVGISTALEDYKNEWSSPEKQEEGFIEKEIKEFPSNYSTLKPDGMHGEKGFNDVHQEVLKQQSDESFEQPPSNPPVRSAEEIENDAKKFVTSLGWGPDFCAEGHDMIKCYIAGFNAAQFKAPDISEGEINSACEEWYNKTLPVVPQYTKSWLAWKEKVK